MSIIATHMLFSFCGVDTSSFFTSPCTVWFPIVLIASLAILSVIALIYMLSPLAGRNDIKVWARVKIYDELANIVMVLIFLSFATVIATIPPASALSSVKLLPNECNPHSADAAAPMKTLGSKGDNIYSIADCDIWLFNGNLETFSESVYLTTLVLGLAPGIQPFADIAYDSGKGVLQGTGITFAVNFMPINLIHHYLVPLMSAFFAVIIASLVQQVLINSALPLFSFLMVMGLIARSFGITRTAGGALIAFALGIGFVYPLTVSISYGFLDYTLSALPQGGSLTQSLPAVAGETISYFFNPITVIDFGYKAATGGGIAAIVAYFIGAFGGPLIYGGFIALGLTLIPLLNLVIVDAFIADFSKEVGERMDLLSMLTKIL